MPLRRAGKLAEAAAIYSEILREQPKHFEALHALGILRYQAGELDEAERLIAEAVLINPHAADALYNRGSLLLKLNRREEALACFASALAIKPDYAEALGNRGTALMQLGRYAEALSDLDHLVRLRPGLAEGWHMRGEALRALDRFEDAHASYSRALEIKPNYPEARRGRAANSLVLANFAEALADADSARTLDPKNAEAWRLRADALARLGRGEAALVSYDKALALKPGTLEPLHNRANTLLGLRRFEEAARDYEKALQIASDCPYGRDSLAFCKLCGCDWQNLDETIAAVREGLRAGLSVAPFHALVLAPGAADALAAARLFSAQKFPPAPEPLWKGEVYRHDRIRVAYLSANFHDHAVARLMAGVFEHHNRKRFEIFAFSFGPGDNGPMRARLAQAFDRFIDVQGDSAERTAQRLRQMEIDIAVDLVGFTEGCRPGILRHRPAPVQVNYLGFPGTMGAEYLDYIIADRIVIPEDQGAYYTEKVVHLPHCYLPGGGTRDIAERVPSRVEAGLPEKGFVFCCFNHVYKITPAMFDIWMRLLSQIEGSVLWLLQAQAGAAANLRREAEARGVAPGRLVFADFVARDADHLARLSLADLFLDTLPYNAHATASDALWAGVPVLTVMGTGFPGRVAASLLRAIGLEEMIAPSLDAYEALALRLARDRAALEAVKAKLARNRDTCALFDTARFTRDLERAFVRMVERQREGLAPQSFAVEGSP